MIRWLSVLSCVTASITVVTGPVSAQRPDLVAMGSVEPARCAADVARTLRPFTRRHFRGDAQARRILHAIGEARGCGLPADLRAAARRAARIHWTRQAEVLAPWFETRGACADVATDPLASRCYPTHPDLARLVVTQGLERSVGPDRRVLVRVVDAMARASGALLPVAQQLWTWANWNFRCVPGHSFLTMQADLRRGVIATEKSYLHPREAARAGRRRAGGC